MNVRLFRESDRAAWDDYVMSHPAGLHEYLTGERKLEDLLVRTKVKKLMLLTAGKPARRPACLFQDEGFAGSREKKVAECLRRS